MSDPSTVIDDWVNATKASALSTTDAVLRGLNSTGDFDPAQQWFLTWYAVSTGLGILVMSFAVLIAVMRSRDKGSPAELVSNVFGYMPAGIVMMLFSLTGAQLLLEFTKVLTDGITAASGSTVTEMIENIYNMVGEINSETLVGGNLVGLIFFGLLLLGAMSVYLGLLMHQIGLPLAACIAGVGYGMWVHPTWRVKALRPVMTFVGIVLSKPLLFLLISIVLAGANNALLAGGGGGSGDLSSLGALALVGASMVVVSLAPWALLKWAPLLPTKADSEGFGGGGGSVAGGVIGGAGSSALFRGRSGGGGRGVGGSNATPRSTPSGSGVSATSRAPHARSGSAPATGHSGTGRNGGGAATANSGGAASKLGMATRLGAKLVTGSASIAATSGAAAIPIAAQTAAAAMNKAKSGAESSASESEGR